MKFNWGTKIAILYIGFIGLILFMVVKSFGEKFDLVTEDYYAKEIAFQSQIDDRIRAEELDRNLVVSTTGEELSIEFPHKKGTLVKGNINCFRPSDMKYDFEVPFEITESVYRIPLSRFISGKYRLKMHWSSEGKDYYEEKIVIIP
jgi:hypothetical protein